jgi:hypothetical protein
VRNRARINAEFADGFPRFAVVSVVNSIREQKLRLALWGIPFHSDRLHMVLIQYLIVSDKHPMDAAVKSRCDLPHA